MAKEYNQIGATGLHRQGGYIYEEFMPILRWPRAARVYQEMADNDPVVGAVLYMAEMLIRNVDWTTEAGGDSEEAKKQAEFLEQCLNDMDMSWADTISEILSMLTYGFSFHEVIYKIRKGPTQSNGKYRTAYNDGKIGWRRIPIRSQGSLHQWNFHKDGDIKSFVQELDYTSNVEIPLSKGLLFRTRVARDNPEGKSLLRNAYRPWYFKKHIEEIEGIGIERDLAGFPVLTAPEDLDLYNEEDKQMIKLKANAEDLVKSIRRDSEEGVLLPHGWDLKLLSTGSARQFDTNAIINRYDNRIAITMLSDLVLIGGGEVTGSFALADTKKSLLATALEAQIQNIADVFNKYAVPKLMLINGYGTEEAPKIVPGEVETPSIKEIALLLRSMGLDISKDRDLQNHLRKVASIPSIEEGDFNKVYAAQEKAAQDPAINTDDTVTNDFEQSDAHYEGGDNL